MNEDKKHPQRENSIRFGFVLLTDEQKLNKEGNTDSDNKEYFHRRMMFAKVRTLNAAMRSLT